MRKVWPLDLKNLKQYTENCFFFFVFIFKVYSFPVAKKKIVKRKWVYTKKQTQQYLIVCRNWTKHRISHTKLAASSEKYN